VQAPPRTGVLRILKMAKEDAVEKGVGENVLVMIENANVRLMSK